MIVSLRPNIASLADPEFEMAKEPLFIGIFRIKANLILKEDEEPGTSDRCLRLSCLNFEFSVYFRLNFDVICSYGLK